MRSLKHEKYKASYLTGSIARDLGAVGVAADATSRFPGGSLGAWRSIVYRRLAHFAGIRSGSYAITTGRWCRLDHSGGGPSMLFVILMLMILVVRLGECLPSEE